MANLIYNPIVPRTPEKLQQNKILFDSEGFPSVVSSIARYYSGIRLSASQLSASKTWTEINALFSTDRFEIVITVTNVGSANPTFTFTPLTNAEKTGITALPAPPPTTMYFVIEKAVLDQFVPQKPGTSIVLLMGNKGTNRMPNYCLMILRNSLTNGAELGGGGPPYSACIIPNH